MAASISDAAKCQYNFLGKSGLRVSNICLGALTFGDTQIQILQNQLDEPESYKLLDRFAEWGGTFIDTADYYGKGNSEKVVGSWLSKQERDRFVIATKVFGPMDSTNPNAAGLSRRHITSSIDNSLKRLQTDYVDLYQTHIWDIGVPIRETIMTLNDLVRCGKVRYLGASNVTGWQMQKIVDLTEHIGLNPYISLQQQYSLLNRESELEAFEVCMLNGLGVLPWSPLKGGLLAGKVKRDQIPEEGTRLRVVAENETLAAESAPFWQALKDDPRVWNTLDKMKAIGDKHGKSEAQVALRWLLQKPVVTSVIIGATKLSQLDDNMGAASGWELSKEEMTELDQVSGPAIPYPYKFVRASNQLRNNPWNPSGAF